MEDGRLIVEPIEAEMLETLLARLTPDNLHGEQLADAPLGRELP